MLGPYESGKFMRCVGCVSLLFVSSLLPAQLKPDIGRIEVPFVGCASDGQQGPVRAPRGKPHHVIGDADSFRDLAYYKARYGFGVLAPRGWYCFGAYGSSGESIYVTPRPLSFAEMQASVASPVGPVVQLDFEYAGSAGRFGIASIIARVFPERMSFLDRLRKEDLSPSLSFPKGPYRNDELVHIDQNAVEYESPPESDGLYSETGLKRSSLPTHGVAILVGLEPDLQLLAVRLPDDLKMLAPLILQDVERNRPPAGSKY
jgi:hypothetical protein